MTAALRKRRFPGYPTLEEATDLLTRESVDLATLRNAVLTPHGDASFKGALGELPEDQLPIAVERLKRIRLEGRFDTTLRTRGVRV